jgi:hypothetical protein
MPEFRWPSTAVPTLVMHLSDFGINFLFLLVARSLDFFSFTIFSLLTEMGNKEVAFGIEVIAHPFESVQRCC